jgi:hypothetical protein
MKETSEDDEDSSDGSGDESSEYNMMDRKDFQTIYRLF